MRARLRSYGETSTRTRSPGRMRMRNRRILPATCPSTSWPLSSCTRNMAFGSASTTSPSNSTFSSFAKRSASSDRPYVRGLRALVAIWCSHPPRRAGLYQARRRAHQPWAPPPGIAPSLGLGARSDRLRLGRRLRRALVLVRVELRPAGGVLLVLRLRLLLVALRLGGRVVLAAAQAELVAAVAGVLPEERPRLERLLRLRERPAEVADDRLHVGAPDVRRERAAVDVAAEVQAVHLGAVVGVADPHGGGQAGREADEPGVGVVVGRPGLAAGRAADVRVRAGAALDVGLEDLRRLVGHAVREHLGAVRAPAVRQLGVPRPLERDLRDR